MIEGLETQRFYFLYVFSNNNDDDNNYDNGFIVEFSNWFFFYN